ncbi:MAG: hypothetical protein EXS14_09980 [Planctomycetes bacterium]|nr:hypothetical protein [Planctomycetota bacterium]
MSAARPNPLPLLLAPIPGLPQWVLGRARSAFFLFITFVFAANLALLSRIVPLPLPSHAVFACASAIAVGTFVFGAVDAWRLAIANRTRRAHAEREQWFLQGRARYLARDYGAARERFLHMLDRDSADPLARVTLAALERRTGNPHTAIEHANAALRSWKDNPFKAELERELALALEDARGR